MRRREVSLRTHAGAPTTSAARCLFGHMPARSPTTSARDVSSAPCQRSPRTQPRDVSSDIYERSPTTSSVRCLFGHIQRGPSRGSARCRFEYLPALSRVQLRGVSPAPCRCSPRRQPRGVSSDICRLRHDICRGAARCLFGRIAPHETDPSRGLTGARTLCARGPGAERAIAHHLRTLFSVPLLPSPAIS